MAKGTKKVGITGRYGPRYGVKVRKQIRDISRHRARAQRCPECQHDAVKRISSGIWFCNHCKLKFAAAAYSTRMRSFRREEAKSQMEEFEREDAVAAAEGEAPREAPAEPKPGEPIEEPEKLVKEKTVEEKPAPKKRVLKRKPAKQKAPEAEEPPAESPEEE
jgi:large subunit ribosomal protein L37Ae